MDNIDTAIVELLRTDGRTSNAEIARHVGVSEGTVRRRLKRLMDENMVRIRVVSDPNGLGRSSQCIVGVTVNPADIDAVLEQVCARDEVTFAASTTGSYDMLVCVSVENPERLGQFLMSDLGAIPGIRRTETYIVLAVGKDSLGQFGG